VDESVRHLQDSSFQVSLGREGAKPVWVGMGWLETKSGDFLQSKQYTARHSLIRLTRAELKLQLISSIARSSIHQEKCDRELNRRAITQPLYGFFVVRWRDIWVLP
jgi:hypothetical protein